MTNTIIDLWPEIDISKINERSPHLILKQQAEILIEKTLGIVEARVLPIDTKTVRKDENFMKIKGAEEYRFFYVFTLVAPVLGNYSQPLFVVAYPMEFYPCMIGDLYGTFADKGQASKVVDEQGLMEVLRQTFASEKTQKILQALISQSKE